MLVILALGLAAASSAAPVEPSPGDDSQAAVGCPRYSTLYDHFGDRFTLHRGPAWAPSGRRIAVRSGSKVVVIDVRSGRRSVVARLPNASLGLAWSPRGGHLAAFTENDIFIGRPPRLLRIIARGCFGAWSPSGRRFAFTARGWARTAKPDGSQSRRVTRAAAVTDWSPDERRLLLLRFRTREQCQTPGSRAYVLRLGRGSLRPLTEHRVVGGEYAGRERGDQVDAVFSPDGRRMSWSEGPPCGAILFPVVGEPQPVTYVADKPLGRGYGDWSPSSQLVALRSSGLPETAVTLVEPGGRRVRYLPKTGGFSWSPDGGRIAFDRDEGHGPSGSPGSSLYLSSSRQPSSDRLLVSRGYWPVWSPDGSRIAFWRATGTRGCSNEFFVVSARGGTPRKLLGC